MTFEEFASRWLNRQTKYAPSTIAAYRRMLEVVYPMIGGIRLNKLRPMALENMLSALRKRKHHGKLINESTAQRYLSVVSAVLSDAKRNEIVEKNPARMLDLPTPQRTVQRIPTRGEVEKLLDALAREPRHYRLFYLLSMYTGCRRGELCALQWSDFTGTQNGLLLTVSRSRSSVPGKGIAEGSTKNGKSREVYLSSDLRGILLAYKRRKQMEADKQRRGLSPYLFTDEQGQLIHPDTFTKRLTPCSPCSVRTASRFSISPLPVLRSGPAHDCCFRRNSFSQENCDSFTAALAVCCACKISLNCTEDK